ncbi:MAG: alpha-L-fucosidase [Dysgonamonadaceae bacterium]|jgi:alpha-L-fucosidase|nr:alpha-L-fucosidase [Dysgonamonadaceae bacterium]
MKNHFCPYFLSIVCFLSFVWVACGDSDDTSSSPGDAPAPYGALPSPQQVEWQKMEYYMFVHFGPNTFTESEWGTGLEDPNVFNPTNLDCRQWARTAKAAGMKAIILTVKHHDGFCLWPTRWADHSVKKSQWKNGEGDVLRELSEACREYGLKMGIYMSPWDRNNSSYGTDYYNRVYANSLAEVLSRYGSVFEIWFDGANGEGPNGKEQAYDWALFTSLAKRNQPDILCFWSPYMDLRWVGNEKGQGSETNWATYNAEYGTTPALGTGIEDGKIWIPAEADVSIRPGWFHRPATDNQVKSIETLLDIYYHSVGRNTNLLLNVPPDKRGMIHPNDSTRLMELRKILDETFKVNLAQSATITTSNTRGNSSKYKAQNLLDEDYDTYWATDDRQLSASIEIDWNKPQSFNRLMLQEYIPLGQRVKSFSVEYWKDGQWQLIDNQTTIGYKRILCFPAVSAQKLRITIKEALACPVISSLGIYKAPGD